MNSSYFLQIIAPCFHHRTTHNKFLSNIFMLSFFKKNCGEYSPDFPRLIYWNRRRVAVCRAAARVVCARTVCEGGMWVGYIF
jgi:hypothetical protein